jgi:hypothetical protein
MNCMLLGLVGNGLASLLPESERLLICGPKLIGTSPQMEFSDKSTYAR